MLKKIKWYYESSNEKDKIKFYEEYIDLLREWCEHYGIDSTDESYRLERLIEEDILCLKYPNT